MLTKKEEELKKMSIEVRDELLQALNENRLLDYIFDRALNIKKDANDNISSIVFTLGGPYIHLDCGTYGGSVVAEDLDYKMVSIITYETSLVMREELEAIE